MDDNDSGLISYFEFAGMVREELLLTPKELPEKVLMAAWLALDVDGSGKLRHICIAHTRHAHCVRVHCQRCCMRVHWHCQASSTLTTLRCSPTLLMHSTLAVLWAG